MAKAMGEASLGDYLVQEGLLNQQTLNKALEQQRATNKSLGRILVETGMITESMRMTILQKQFGYELVRLKDFKADPMLLTMVPYSFAEKHRVVPLRQENRNLVVAMEDPSDMLLIDAFKNQIGMSIQAVIASQEDIQQILNQYQTRAEEQKALTIQEAIRKRPSLMYRILKAVAFPIIALAPLVLFLAAIYTNFNDYADDLNNAHKNGIISWGDMFIYIPLVWGLWAIVTWYINGLIFDPRRPADEPADA